MARSAKRNDAEKRPPAISVKLDETLLIAVDESAHADHRTRAQQVRVLLAEALASRAANVRPAAA